MHDVEDVSATDARGHDDERLHRGGEAREAPKILVDFQEHVPPSAVCDVEPRLVDHLVEVVERLAAQHADRDEREGRRDEVTVRDLFHAVD